MTVLAFDCAVSGMTVAVVRDGVHLAVLADEGRDQAARLLPAIAAVLAEARVDRRDLSLIATTVGPGSFTGVRVGLAAARGLAVGLGIPLAGIATTSVLLAQSQPGKRLAIAAIDSRLGDWFCAINEAFDGRLAAPFAASAHDLAGRIAGRPCFVIGTGVKTLAASLVAAGIDAIAEEAVPDSVVLAYLAEEASVDVWRAQNEREGLPRPLYLRGVNITLPDGARRTVDQ
jgi:tRNA threonylcarbamoyladenosine biosynthesis protein TsaB